MSLKGFGLYVHIPHCLQKCHYCDFVTTTVDSPPSASGEYVTGVLAELRRRSFSVRELSQGPLTSIYFGGGTPSLLPAQDILAVLLEIATAGFNRTNDCEISIEINPGTIDDEKLDLYLAAGVNRFSIGVQTFSDESLRAAGRKHSAEETRKTLRLFADRSLNYSADILFGLPHQRIKDLQRDLSELFEFSPPHVSLYNLTLPRAHFMNRGRAPDEEQVRMFETIELALSRGGILRYEISNFAKPGFESRHNQLYWQGGAYWGLGVGAHSYLPQCGKFGVRFANPASMRAWRKQVENISEQESFWSKLPSAQVEHLALHEALTDFFHTRLRQTSGFLWREFHELLSAHGVCAARAKNIEFIAQSRLKKLASRDLIIDSAGRVRLSEQGYPLANVVFLELTFAADEVIGEANLTP